MQIPEEHIKEIKKFNRNIDWLKRKHISDTVIKVSGDIISSVKEQDRWLSTEEAIKFIGRSRSWIDKIRESVQGIEHTSGAPMMKLFRGQDWKRETNKIYYRLSSLENLKIAMQKAGDAYDERIGANR